MLRVLIIDDEVLVRVGLKSMLNWEELGFELCGEATNGRDGLDLIIRLQPDIVLTDIKMPVMDGLEMMRLASEAGCRPKYIILSSYDDFLLVKQAMKQGAEEYLIKLDLEPAVLSGTLSAVAGKIRGERGRSGAEERFEKVFRENIAMLREVFFKELINRPFQVQGDPAARAADLGIELDEAALVCALVRMNDPTVLDKYGPHDLRMLEVSFLDTINEIVNDVFKGYTFAWNRGEFVAVYSANPGTPPERYRESAVKMAERWVQVLKQYSNISVSVGLSKPHSGYTELAQAYLESCRAVQQVFYAGSRSIFFFEDLPETGDDPGRIDLAGIRNVLPQAVELHDLDTIHTVMESIITVLEEQKLPRGQAFDLCFQIAYLIGGAAGLDERAIQEIIGYKNSLYESIFTLNTLPEIINWFTGVEQRLCLFLTRNEDQKNQRLIAKAKKYIQDHCSEEIGLNEIAAELNISPGYFSTIFKQLTGIGFSDYVTEKKIEQAKKLLRESDYKIYEVSNLLGYQNPYYFSKVFKKVTGVTPSEFSGKKF